MSVDQLMMPRVKSSQNERSHRAKGPLANRAGCSAQSEHGGVGLAKVYHLVMCRKLGFSFRGCLTEAFEIDAAGRMSV
jgi:hypothetical protein